MRVLVLGAGGMLGHKLMQRLSAQGFEVAGTIRATAPDQVLREALPSAKLLTGISAEHLDSVECAIQEVRPHAVANCIGIIKQLDEAKDPVPSIAVNALFPHRLAHLCRQHDARLIHFSTDCVFSGDRGPYRDDSFPDAGDLYGRTKLLGEVGALGALTIRSSIIGHELRGHRSLVDWFLSQQGGRIKGFANALYTGVTTAVMADLVGSLLSQWPDLHGVWQVASTPVSKYDLLVMLRQIFSIDVVIERDEVFHCDRRLDGSRFYQQTGWTAPSWLEMAQALYEDCMSYPDAAGLRLERRAEA